MKEKTLKELRELAKARGIRGYSKLTKAELVAQLDTEATTTSTESETVAPGAPARTEPQGAAHAATPASPVPAASGTVTPAAPATPVERSGRYASAEERVEDAKYALRPNGAALSTAPGDLNEDIDRQPELRDPLVCLLPQKPGILHAYWVLPPRESDEDYRLRLCRAGGAALEVREEIPIRSDRGSWYFHVGDEPADAGMLVQLGFYRDGRFHSARGRSIARLPSMYAATRTDERWWVPEAEFMQMYLRAGGFVTPARRFAWSASIGSPSAPIPGPEQRLAWPGGVSSK